MPGQASDLLHRTPWLLLTELPKTRLTKTAARWAKIWCIHGGQDTCQAKTLRIEPHIHVFFSFTRWMHETTLTGGQFWEESTIHKSGTDTKWRRLEVRVIHVGIPYLVYIPILGICVLNRTRKIAHYSNPPKQWTDNTTCPRTPGETSSIESCAFKARCQTCSFFCEPSSTWELG